MRYWGLLAAKLVAAGLLLFALWTAVSWLFPKPNPWDYYDLDPFLHDLSYTLRVLAFGLFSLGLIGLVFLDQRYRCRTCGRRLRMPIETGSWNNMILFGRPKIEYICPYGHGTLKVPEVQITGLEMADWEPHGDDIWKELEQLGETRK